MILSHIELSFSLSLPSFLSKTNKHIFRRGLKKSQNLIHALKVNGNAN